MKSSRVICCLLALLTACSRPQSEPDYDPEREGSAPAVKPPEAKAFDKAAREFRELAGLPEAARKHAGWQEESAALERAEARQRFLEAASAYQSYLERKKELTSRERDDLEKIKLTFRLYPKPTNAVNASQQAQDDSEKLPANLRIYRELTNTMNALSQRTNSPKAK